MLCNFLYLCIDIFCGLYLHSCVAFTIGLFIVFFLFFSGVKIWRFYDCEGISSRMFITFSVVLTYSYN